MKTVVTLNGEIPTSQVPQYKHSPHLSMTTPTNHKRILLGVRNLPINSLYPVNGKYPLHQIDYRSVERRFTAPLRAFLKEIKSRHAQAASVTKIEYHLSNKNRDIGGFKRNLNQWIKPALPNAAKLTFVRWNIDELHNRYLITDRSGVSFVTGLDLDDSIPPSEDVVAAVSKFMNREIC